LNGKDLCGESVILEFSRRGPRGGASDRGGGGGGGGGRGDRDRGGDRGGDRYGGPPRRDSRYGPPQQTRYRLIIENLSSRCSWQDLKDIMRAAGEVTFADAHKQHRNEGLVCFQNRGDLDRALDTLQGKEVNGRRIKLIDDSEGGATRKSRSRSRSPKGSKSKSRSRSARSSRSRSSRSRSKSKSKSPMANDAKKEKEGSRSRSHSAESNEHKPKVNGGTNGDTHMDDEDVKGSPTHSNKSNDD